MDDPPETAPFWEALRRDLTSSFAARARGLLAPEFALLTPGGKEFGQLRLGGVSGAELRSGDGRVAAFEASGEPTPRYRMVSWDGSELLSAAPRGRPVDELEVSCGDRAYGARLRFLRNLAVARRPDGQVSARLSGGLSGRGYEASFDTGDGCALPVAVFLLWHLATNRRRAYRMGGAVGGGRM